jgi:hypothetical protein
MKVSSLKVRYNGCIFFPPFIPAFHSGFQKMNLLRATNGYRQQRQDGNNAFAADHNAPAYVFGSIIVAMEAICFSESGCT